MTTLPSIPAEVTCIVPAHPSHGFLVPSLTVYAYGQQITFHCQQGYQLIGEETVTCISLNTWSSTAPVCEGNIM